MKGPPRSRRPCIDVDQIYLVSVGMVGFVFSRGARRCFDLGQFRRQAGQFAYRCGIHFLGLGQDSAERLIRCLVYQTHLGLQVALNDLGGISNTHDGVEAITFASFGHIVGGGQQFVRRGHRLRQFSGHVLLLLGGRTRCHRLRGRHRLRLNRCRGAGLGTHVRCAEKNGCSSGGRMRLRMVLNGVGV